MKHATEIKITDNGRGYDEKKLRLKISDKPDHEGIAFDDRPIGMHGDGLKRLCAASLNMPFEIILRSRNWVANPKKAIEEVDGKNAEELVFIVNDTEEITGSETRILKPTPEFLAYMANAERKILNLRKLLGRKNEVIYRNEQRGEILID